MTTQIQRRRGTTAQHSTFTGAEAELTVDTTKDTVVVHDGSTVGGRPLLREDQSNLPTSAPTTGIYNASGALAISTNGTGRLFVDASGKIGIGGTPNYNLDLYAGSANFQGANQGIYWDSATNKCAILADTGALKFSTGTSSVVERLRITSAGLVGVGTSSPAFKLQVNSSAASPATIASFRNTAVNSVYVELNDQTGNSTYLGSEDGRFVVQTPGSGYSTKFCVTSSGNVGIGTTTPAAKLHVNVGTNQNYTVTSTNSMVQLQAINDAANAFTPIDIAGSYIKLSPSSSEAARIDTSGRLLLGTSTSGSSLLQVNAQASAAGNGLRSSHQIANSGTGVTQTTQAAPYISYLNGLNVGLDATAIAINGEDFASGNTGLRLEFNLLKSSGAVASGDRLGRISFGGDDGTNLIPGAWIDAFVDGGVSTNDLPTRLVFSTCPDSGSSPVERMRISNTGSVNTYDTAGNGINARSSLSAGTSDNLFVGWHSATGTTSGTFSFIVRTNGNVVNTNNSYGSISDIKLKENIVDATSQWDDIKALQVRKYNFKEGQTHTQIGLIAQEVELVSPGLVNETPDRDAEGNDLGTVTKSVNYSVLYMKAVKALQEAMERIETLEAKVAALETA